VFLVGTVDNELEVWDLFDVVVCLVIDDETLRHRLETRTNNRYGKPPHELDLIRGWNQSTEENYRRIGAVIVDATRGVDEAANAVLEAAGAPIAWPEAVSDDAVMQGTTETSEDAADLARVMSAQIVFKDERHVWEARSRLPRRCARVSGSRDSGSRSVRRRPRRRVGCRAPGCRRRR
jgi:hypothetical protein